MMSSASRKILVLGSGFVAKPCVEYLSRNPNNTITVASRSLERAKLLITGLPNTQAITLDANDEAKLTIALESYDLVISLLPYTYHPTVLRAAIATKTHMITTSYVSPAMRALDAAARTAGILVLNEVGLDPGIDHLYATRAIASIHANGGNVREYHLYCGSLPEPGVAARNPLHHGFAWSPRGSLLALMNAAQYISANKVVKVEGKNLLRGATPIDIPGWDAASKSGLEFVAYPNRDSVSFRVWYDIPEAEVILRATLRYNGFCEVIVALIDMGWMDTTPKEWLSPETTWAEATQHAIGAPNASEDSLKASIRSVCSFGSDSDADRVLSCLHWLGLFSFTKVTFRAGNLLDTLCANLEVLMKLEDGQRDLVVMVHKYVVEWQDGSTETITQTMEMYGETEGDSAMAITVGRTCGIATQLVLDGVFDHIRGIQAPYKSEIVDPIREVLDKDDSITFTERRVRT
ncbi:saccharopine dehydrogenase [Cylindrobasidium torrendii FP15055 ss-10]|uniref:Saccharopine dehydrogenase n=1 Tax=Cylindrobasidium torrendii FP15055 ss-10 TaxID=1314674 RepID=A0A0D7BIA5_9AGAR|nr:saccharopine dehydrogenase [Cylindrobasidium torrendii FP15055 ss-10]